MLRMRYWVSAAYARAAKQVRPPTRMSTFVGMKTPERAVSAATGSPRSTTGANPVWVLAVPAAVPMVVDWFAAPIGALAAPAPVVERLAPVCVVFPLVPEGAAVLAVVPPPELEPELVSSDVLLLVVIGIEPMTLGP